MMLQIQNVQLKWHSVPICNCLVHIRANFIGDELYCEIKTKKNFFQGKGWKVFIQCSTVTGYCI